MDEEDEGRTGKDPEVQNRSTTDFQHGNRPKKVFSRTLEGVKLI